MGRSMVKYEIFGKIILKEGKSKTVSFEINSKFFKNLKIIAI